MKNQKGFTLIELMIVVAIIAILAAIAISQYQDYVAKSQFSEAPSIVDGVKTKIVENYHPDRRLPDQRTTRASRPRPATSASTSLTVDPGWRRRAVHHHRDLQGARRLPPRSSAPTVTFTGSDNGGTFSWTCSSAIDDKYKPQACQD